MVQYRYPHLGPRQLERKVPTFFLQTDAHESFVLHKEACKPVRHRPAQALKRTRFEGDTKTGEATAEPWQAVERHENCD